MVKCNGSAHLEKHPELLQWETSMMRNRELVTVTFPKIELTFGIFFFQMVISKIADFLALRSYS